MGSEIKLGVFANSTNNGNVSVGMHWFCAYLCNMNVFGLLNDKHAFSLCVAQHNQQFII